MEYARRLHKCRESPNHALQNVVLTVKRLELISGSNIAYVVCLLSLTRPLSGTQYSRDEGLK